MSDIDNDVAKADRYQFWLNAVKGQADSANAAETFEDYIRYIIYIHH